MTASAEDVDVAAPEKAEKYTLVPLDDPAYRILREITQAFHLTELAEARIALVWEHEVKEDCDGHLVLGRAKKVSPLEQQFRPHDFTILLNAAAWATLPDSAKRALMDHELCHCGLKTSETTGETSFYLRKHDLEGFDCEVRRHGLWRKPIVDFVNAALRKEQKDLFEQAGGGAEARADAAAEKLHNTLTSIPGVSAVTISHGQTSVTLTAKDRPKLEKLAKDLRRKGKDLGPDEDDAGEDEASS